MKKEAEFKVPDDALARIAEAMAGPENCCCGIYDDEGRCCMTDSARHVLAVLEDVSGIALAEIEGRKVARDYAASERAETKKPPEPVGAEG